MNYLFTHCYSDQNKGDSGIILGAIELIKSADKEAQFTQMSLYDIKDLRFKTHHNFTKSYFKKTICSIFPEPFIKRKESDRPVIYKKVYFLFFSAIKVLTITLLPTIKIAKLIFNQDEFRSFMELIKTDYIISKGGSYLYSFNGLTGLCYFLRMYFIFILAFALNKKVILLGQSIGPLENKIAVWLLKKTAGKFYKIYLREPVCLNLFDDNRISKSNVDVIMDTAFFMKNDNFFIPSEVKLLIPDEDKTLKVAVTALPHNFRTRNSKELTENYIEALICTIKKLIDSHNAIVYLVAQVIGPSEDEDDRIALTKIYESLESKYLNSVVFIKDDLHPKSLLSIYSRMSFVIGTRLHSTIFALSQNIPAINISYHGTKSQGIFKMLGIENFCLPIEKVTTESLYQKANQSINNVYPGFMHKLIAHKKDTENKIKYMLTNYVNHLDEPMVLS